jgi:branched-chain amino acid transport system ATP-binding protein
MLLSVEHVVKSFGQVCVLSDISCSFDFGRVYALVGANGSGKTTLFNLMTGLLQPDRGVVFFNGKNIRGRSTVRLAQSGVARTFQSVKAFQSLTVAENLLTALRNKPDEALWGALLRSHSDLSKPWHDRVDALLEEFHLYDHRTQLAGALSYGQQKLLHFAMITANPFEILLLDEPVAGLQPNFVEETLVRLRAIKKTIIVVEHDMNFIKQLQPEVLYLANGHIIARGTYDEVMGNQRVQETYL